MGKLDPAPLLPEVVWIAKMAGERIKEIYQGQTPIDIKLKADASPVTTADLAAHDIIAAGLKKLTPDVPLLSEEDAAIDFAVRQQWPYYWLVDPLDGTKEFIHRTDEFSVNIALIEAHTSILGVIYAPINDVCYYAMRDSGAYKQNAQAIPQAIHVRKLDTTNLAIAVSRRHVNRAVRQFLHAFPAAQIVKRGSSLKSCSVAEGESDVYPCLGPTSEWDMAAAQCIVEQAGGFIVDTTLNRIQYNTKASLLNPPLLIFGDKRYPWQAYL